jgi:pimeloyl-ACP methyl ester carboxylesterase
MISQVAALKYPGRVLSITCIASGIFSDVPDLPQMDPRIIEFQSKAYSEVDWSDKQSVADFMVGGVKLLNGTKHPFLVDRAYRLAFAEIERAENLFSMFNHAMLQGGEEYYGRTSEIKVPVLIIHGSEDLILPLPHAQAIKKALLNSKLVVLEGVGHELQYYEWDRILDSMEKHFKMG